MNCPKTLAFLVPLVLCACGGGSSDQPEPSGDPDLTPPLVQLLGDNPLALTVGDTFVDPGAFATDDRDGVVDVSVSGSVNTGVAGSYLLSYSAVDAAGNTATSTRTVNVSAAGEADLTAPEITVNGDNPLALNLDEPYVEAGASAFDLVDGSVAVTISGTVDTATAGTYLLTYSASDSAGNEASSTRTVTVSAPDPTSSYSQSFDGADGDPWPSEWQIPSEDNSPLVAATIQGNRGYLSGIPGGTNVSRMIMRDLQLENFDARFSIQFESFDRQGIGFYGRQNGGRLTGTSTHGQGYAVFIEGYTFDVDLSLTLWHELDGNESREGITRMDNLLASNDEVYRVRYRVAQLNSETTRLQAKLWLASDAEPADWQLSFDSNNSVMPGVSVLQNISDGFAVDIYNESETLGIYIDDIVIDEIVP